MCETSNKIVADAILDLLTDHYGDDAGVIALLLCGHLLEFASSEFANLAGTRDTTTAVAGMLKSSASSRHAIPPETIAVAREALKGAGTPLGYRLT